MLWHPDCLDIELKCIYEKNRFEELHFAEQREAKFQAIILLFKKKKNNFWKLKTSSRFKK